MERSIELLDLNSAKEPIPDWDSENSTVDPYQSMQVHDYLQVSFFRTPAEVKNASKKTVELFQKYYPELLEKKFFVNVPFLMGWVYNAMKLLVAKETFKKLVMLSYGQELAKHMGSKSIPTTYGGDGKLLAESMDGHASAQAGSGATSGEGAAAEDTNIPAPTDTISPVPVPVSPVSEAK